MATYIDEQGTEIEVAQATGRAQLEALGWTLLRGDALAEEAAPRFTVAATIVVDHEAGVLLVNGEPIVYAIGDNPLVTEGGANDVRSVWVQLLADKVSVVGEPAPNANEVPADLGSPVGDLDSAYTEPTAGEAEKVESAEAPWLGDLPGDAERAVAAAEKATAGKPAEETFPEPEPEPEPVSTSEPEPDPAPKRPRTRRSRADS